MLGNTDRSNSGACRNDKIVSAVECAGGNTTKCHAAEALMSIVRSFRTFPCNEPRQIGLPARTRLPVDSHDPSSTAPLLLLPDAYSSQKFPELEFSRLTFSSLSTGQEGHCRPWYHGDACQIWRVFMSTAFADTAGIGMYSWRSGWIPATLSGINPVVEYSLLDFAWS